MNEKAKNSSILSSMSELDLSNSIRDSSNHQQSTAFSSSPENRNNTLASSKNNLLKIAMNQTYVGSRQKYIRPSEDIFDASNRRIKEDMMKMICQYLNDEGYEMSRVTLMDEAAVKWQETQEKIQLIKRMKKSILDGEWAEVDRINSKVLVRNHKSFLYAVYKQQYLEYIENHDIQKALTHLNKRLKPLEHFATTPNEFRDLCYLLTTKNIHDSPAFKNWEGIQSSRERLVEQFQNMFDFEYMEGQGHASYIPPHRLLTLLRQAVAYQIEFSQYHPNIAPQVCTLLEDYKSTIIPNTVKSIFRGHTKNVKCVDFIGEDGELIISGSSDNTCKIWSIESAECVATLKGHTSRIWDVTSYKMESTVASASADKSVKIWDLKGGKYECLSTLLDHEGDVYTVRYHPAGKHLVTGGYDHMVRLFDIERETVVKNFAGHSLGVSRCIFSPAGNLIISASKDCTIKFWDVVSGICVKSISTHLGEVTSVEMNSNGLMLLSGSKDNANRLWDVRMLRPIKRYKGHQNTSKNFIRSGFAGDSLIIGGSEDGAVYIWDTDKGDVLQRLKGHDGIAYGIAYNAQQSLLVSSSDDNTIRSWWFDNKIKM